MKKLFIIIFFLSFGHSFCQDNVMMIERYCLDSTCTKKQKLQHTFNQRGDILEYTFFGDNHNSDSTHIGNITKFKYYDSNLIEKTSYIGTSYINYLLKFSYKKGRLDVISFGNDEISKYLYNTKGNRKAIIMTKGSDTICIRTYTYKGNKLSEIYNYINKIDNAKFTYFKSKDTLIETISRHDSIYIDKPLLSINKKIFNRKKLMYSSSFYGLDNSNEENFITYDTHGNVIKIESSTVVNNLVKKEKSNFLYHNGLLSRIEKFEYKNNSWQPKNSITYEMKEPKMKIKEKIKKKINIYFQGMESNITD